MKVIADWMGIEDRGNMGGILGSLSLRASSTERLASGGEQDRHGALNDREKAIKGSRIVMLVTDHDKFDVEAIAAHSRLVVDTRGPLSNEPPERRQGLKEG